MKSIKYFFIFAFIIFSISTANANHKTDIYKAFTYNDMKLWKKTIDDMSKETNKTNEYILQLINYQYGYIGWCIGNKRYNEAASYLELAQRYLDILEKRSYKLSYVNSYKSAFYGFKIGINKLEAPFLGSKSLDCAENSIKLDANNPFGYFHIGYAKYYMPGIFGGSKDEAINYYIKAQKIMEGTTYNRELDWNYLNLLTVIGNSYVEVGKYQIAKGYYDKILKLEPNYIWVKEKLYPELKKKM